MTVRAYWSPSTDPAIAYYDVQRGPSSSGAWVSQIHVSHSLSGANYDTLYGQFFYDDPLASGSDWFRVAGVDTYNQYGAFCSPFQAELEDPPLASLADLKDYLGVTVTGSDALLTRILKASSQWFESQIGYSVPLKLYQEVRDGNNLSSITPYEMNVRQVLSVVVDGVQIPPFDQNTKTGWVLVDGRIKLVGYKFGGSSGGWNTGNFGTAAYAGNVTLTYTAGYPVVPQDIQQAVIEVAADRFKSRARIGVMNQSISGESVSFQTLTIPVSVKTVIDTYLDPGYA